MAMEKIEAIREWAEFKPWFDLSFVDSLEEAYNDYGELTDAQECALDRIIEGFKIEV